jgi:non-specific serine/threonine protein kinase
VTDVLDLLASLVEKSLVVVDDRGGEPRYRLLDTIREYARDRLHASEGEAAIRRRHLAYIVALAEAGARGMEGPEQAAWAARLERELDNIRAALGWGLEADRDGEAALRVAAALSWFWFLRHTAEGRTWLTRTLTRAKDANPVIRAWALRGAGELAGLQGDIDTARAHIGESRDLYRAVGDELGLAHALYSFGWVLLVEDPAAAHRALEESVAVFRRLDMPREVARSLAVLGHVIASQGDPATGRALLEEALAGVRAVGERSVLGWINRHLGYAALALGDRASAATAFKDSLAVNLALGERRATAASLVGLARLAQASGHMRRAARLLGAATAHLEVENELLLPDDRVECDRTVAGVRAALSAEAFSEAWAEGRMLSVEAAAADGFSEATRPTSDASASSPHTAGLTEREVEVLRLLAAGKSNREIAAALVISVNTVFHHVGNILGKTGASNRTEAAAYALRHGLAGESAGRHDRHRGE